MATSKDPVAAAAALKEKGNALFKASKFTEAFLKYNEAFNKLKALPTDDSQDPAYLYQSSVLLSNRSNCLFELGKYEKAIEDGRQCLSMLETIPATQEGEVPSSTQVENLKKKNLLRIARSGIYGTDIDCAEASDAYQINVLEPLQYLASCGEDVYEKRAERMIEQAAVRRKMLMNRKEASTKERPPLPSIHRASVSGSSICEYYNFGHDKIASALAPGCPSNEVPHKPSCPGIRLDKMPSEHLSKLSLLFGGVGDARHVYATVCDAHKQWKNLDPEKRDGFCIRLVLNDINTTAVSRDVLIIAALIRLGKSAPNFEKCQERGSEAFGLATLIEYTFWGYSMPQSVYELQMQLIDDLVDVNFASLKAFVIANDDVWSEIERVFLYWRKAKEGKHFFPTNRKVMREIFNAHQKDDIRSTYQEGTEEFKKVQDMKRKRRQENVQRKEAHLQRIANGRIEDFPDAVADFRQSLPPARRSDHEVLKAVKTYLLQRYAEMDPDDFVKLEEGKTSPGRYLDHDFMEIVNAILPPRGCAGPRYDSIWKANDDDDDPDHCELLIKEAKNEVESQWKVNRTMFDPDWTKIQNGQFSANIFNPIEVVGSDFFNSYTRIMESFVQTVPDPADLSFFECSTLFFWNTAHALHNLFLTDSIRLELDAGSITTLCRKLQNDSTGVIEKFHRIFLSNIPDYIGMLSVFTEIFPLLHRPSKNVYTFVQSSVLLNTGIWEDFSHYVYSATGIPTAKELLNLVGIRHLTPDSVWIHQNQMAWTESGETKASREELTLWLHRVLLLSLMPPTRNVFSHAKEQCVMNTAMFLRLCAFCVENLKYPPHWIGSVLDDVVVAANSSGILKTRTIFPKSTPVKYQAESKKTGKIDLRAFRGDLLTQSKIWTDEIYQVLIPVESLPILSALRCQKYKIRLGRDNEYMNVARSIGTGGADFSMCLGFVVSKEKHPDGFDGSMFPGDFLPRTPEFGKGSIRAKALRGSDGLQIFSCAKFICDLSEHQEHYMEFFMSTAHFEKYADLIFHPIRTDTWNQLGIYSANDLMHLRDASVVDAS